MALNYHDPRTDGRCNMRTKGRLSYYYFKGLLPTAGIRLLLSHFL